MPPSNALQRPFDAGGRSRLIAVCYALEDPDCHQFVNQLREPMTASELSDATGISLSTTYRKLSRLTDAGLVAETIDICAQGHHSSQYRVAFERIEISRDDGGEVEVSITPPDGET